MQHEWVRALNREKELCEEFFQQIDNDKKAYWLGFIAADGSIRKNSLVIKLKQSDSGHLGKLLKDLKANYEIKMREDEIDFGDGKGPQKYQSATISCCSISYVTIQEGI